MLKKVICEVVIVDKHNFAKRSQAKTGPASSAFCRLKEFTWLLKGLIALRQLRARRIRRRKRRKKEEKKKEKERKKEEERKKIKKEKGENRRSTSKSMLSL